MRNLEIYSVNQRNVDPDKIQELEDTVKILLEQIDTLKLELDYKDQKLLEITEELSYTNQELGILNESFTNSLALLNITQGEELDKNLLTNKKSARSNLFSQTAF